MDPQQQKIQNPETPIAKTSQMNERDMINDMLATEKYMTSSYNIALYEASNQAYYQLLQQILTETQDCQRNLFNQMFQQGWYSLEKADQQKVMQTHQQFSGYTTQFPYQ
ncbi:MULTISPECIES: spore coat protein [unclassified Virgibacillus]|uniref:spore coat protein n=1 Tax=unclassified Virgibacillus TaxID=2620237 RepID=UPI0024DE60E2|nr:spore coat protein [Virgibacillus sp. LDC-1]